MPSWSERDRTVLWHPYTQMQTSDPPIVIVRGEGATLIDESGRRYLDGISSWWTSLHGHAHPQIAARVARQAAELEHVIFAGFTHRPAIELAEKVLRLLPAGQSHLFFSDNGSTAVEVALKMAIQHWVNRGEGRRRRIVALEGGYHGDTFGAMSVSAPGPFTEPFRSFLFEADRIPFPGEGDESRSLQALEKLLARGDVAALIVEPLVQGAGGMKMSCPAAFNGIFAAARRSGALIIADEVMTGFYRTGRPFACSHLEERPDIVCLSKGLTGGTMALGATTCTDEVFESFLSQDRTKTFFHGHSFTANPIACAAGLASLDLLETAECRSAIARISDAHRRFVAEIAADPGLSHRLLAPRALGTILAMEFPPGSPGSGYLDPAGPRLSRYFIEEGILLRPLGNTLYVLPPYCLSAEDLQRIYESIRKAAENLL